MMFNVELIMSDDEDIVTDVEPSEKRMRYDLCSLRLHIVIWP